MCAPKNRHSRSGMRIRQHTIYVMRKTVRCPRASAVRLSPVTRLSEKEVACFWCPTALCELTPSSSLPAATATLES